MPNPGQEEDQSMLIVFETRSTKGGGDSFSILTPPPPTNFNSQETPLRDLPEDALNDEDLYVYPQFRGEIFGGSQ